ncbi:ubiquitin-conjugating enzyme/RWD-like protein [Geopyxis carbonaria]|nr:ubiquitin-conjugating enzyme/RWD-like protein [Geopyxis carbonaria]
MASANRRRLAKDQAALMESPPPDYFFLPSYSGDDMSVVSVYLVGPSSTPFEDGVFHITLRVPPNYPAEPPKAAFHTKIFHPNVDTNTGGICVETLKRDWDPKLTLTDILVTIRCLLVYPNPTSALNESAGKLLLDDYDGFSRHARLMTEIHARIPENLKELVFETRNRRAEDEDTDVSNPKLAVPSKKQEPIRPSSSRTGGNAQPRTRRTASSALGTKPVGGRTTSSGQAVRKIKRAVSPTAKVSSDHASDSEGSGKENVISRRLESPTGIKRSREQIEHPAFVEGEGFGGKESSGRKSPKLGHRNPLLTEALKKANKKAAEASKSKSRKKKSDGPKLGLKRF